MRSTKQLCNFVVKNHQKILSNNIGGIRQISSSIPNTTDGESSSTDYYKLRVFRNRPTNELVRSWLVLKLSSMKKLVNNSEKLINFGQTVVPKIVFDETLKKSFFSQFVIGDTIQNSLHEVDRLKANGIQPMLCVPIESLPNHMPDHERQERYSINYEIIKDCAYKTAQIVPHGFAQAKITAICDKELLMEMNKYLLPYETNHKEPGDWSISRVAQLLEEKRYKDISFVDLTESTNEKLRTLFRMLDEFCQIGKDLNIRIALDAEQTYLQAALGYLILVLQAKYNKHVPIVYNTYQCYRKDTLTRVKADRLTARNLHFKIAAKLVRGAYMVEERQIARDLGNEDPINNSYEDTNDVYHAVVDELLPMVCNKEVGLMVASHNEDTVDYLIKSMKELNIPKDDGLLYFGQLYGMCDHVSYYLGMNGYQIVKSTPYGTIDDCLLYLARRAHENHSVLERTQLERKLIKKELVRRTFSASNSDDIALKT